MEGGIPWRKVALTCGAAAALAVVIRHLRQKAEEGKSLAAPGPKAKAEEKPEAKATPKEPAKKEPASGPSLEAQKNAAMGGAARDLAPDFNAPLEQDIERRLRARFKPTYLELVNMGSCDAVKLGVNMVSEVFRGQSRINRQRDVQAVVKPDLENGRLHAISLQLKTPEEYKKLTDKQEGKPAEGAKPAGAQKPAKEGEGQKTDTEKWLTSSAKADAKPAPKAQPSKGDSAAPPAEKRKDPWTGKTFTLPELQVFYKTQYNAKEIQKYWNDECKPISGTNGGSRNGGGDKNRQRAKQQK